MNKRIVNGLLLYVGVECATVKPVGWHCVLTLVGCLALGVFAGLVTCD